MFLLLVILLKTIYLSKSENCTCNYWKSLDGLPHFLYDIENHLLMDFQTVYVFDKNCILDHIIRFLNEINITTIFYTLADDPILFQNLASSLSVFKSPPIYVILLICLSPETADKVIDISQSVSTVPLIRWLFFRPEDSLSNLRYSCKTGVVFIDKKTQIFKARGPLLISHNCAKIHQLVKWSHLSGVNSRASVGLLDCTDKKYLQGEKLVVSRLNVYPFFANAGDHHMAAGHVEKYIGIDYTLLRTLSEHFGFRFILETNPDGQWGYKVNSTHWKGMVGRVYHEHADLAMTILSRTAKREEVVDFSYPHYFDSVCFVVKKPDVKHGSLILLQPLSLEIYIAVVVSTVVTSLAVSIICFYDRHCVNQRWRITDAVWYFSAAVTLNGGTMIIPSSSKIRIIVALWWILCIVIMTGYSGKLISFFNVPSVIDTVDTVRKLIHAIIKGIYKAGTADGSSMLHNFMIAKKGDFYIVGRHMAQDPKETIMNNITTGMRNVYDRRYAFIFPKGAIETIAAKMGSDNFVFSKDQFFTTYYAIALRKGTPLKKIFKIPIIRLIEGGLIQKWHKDLLTQKRIIGSFQHGSEISHHKLSPIVLEDIRGSLFLLGIGFLLATIVLIVEMIVHNFRTS